MNRRDFVRWGSAVLAAVPFLGFKSVDAESIKLPTKLPTGINNASLDSCNPFDSIELNKLVRAEAWKLDMQKYPFIQNCAVVEYKDERKLEEDVQLFNKTLSRVFIADIITDDQEGAIYDTNGSFEFTPPNIPNTKMGSRVGTQLVSRIAKIKDNRATAEEKEETLAFIKDWELTLAKSLVTGTHQRTNSFIANVVLGLPTNSSSYGFCLSGTPRPEGVIRNVDWSTENSNPLLDIKKQLRFMKKTYGKTFDTITMTSPTFETIIKSSQFKKRVEKLFLRGRIINEYIALGNLLANKLKVAVEIYDGAFFQKSNIGGRDKIPVIPNGAILFSNSKNNNNPDVLSYVYGTSPESEMMAIFENMPSQTGISAYFTKSIDLNPPDIRAWAVIKGMPLLKDLTAFSTIMAKLPLEASMTADV